MATGCRNGPPLTTAKDTLRVFQDCVFKEAGLCMFVSVTCLVTGCKPIKLGTGWFQPAAKQMRPVCFFLLCKHWQSPFQIILHSMPLPFAYCDTLTSKPFGRDWLDDLHVANVWKKASCIRQKRTFRSAKRHARSLVKLWNVFSISDR